MTSKSNFHKFKTTMKRETTRNINNALKSKQIVNSQAEKYINESRKIIDEGNDEKTIINNLAIHAYNSNYKQYTLLEKALEEVELERKKNMMFYNHLLRIPVHIKMLKNTQKKW